MITLDQLLKSRDSRSARQADWVRENPGSVLVCLTVILPGPVKRDSRSLKVAHSGVAAIREALKPFKEELFDLETGFEGFFLVKGELYGCKRACCAIEDTHPLGRLMDIDVLEPLEHGAAPLSRSRIGLPQRRCLICELPARECMRSRTHSPEELQRRIDEIICAAG